MIGFGNSMFLATHGILARSASGGAVDPDAQAFITAASITDPTQQSAINQLVVDLKGYSIWTKMKALYPFCGGSASSHKFNLKDPRDLDAAFRLTFVGGLTHSATGVKGNGTNGYFRTYLLANTDLPQDNNASGAYIRTNVAEDTIDYGFISSSGHTLSTRLVGNLLRVRNFGNTPDISNLDSRGFYQNTRRNSSQFTFTKGTTKTSNSVSSVSTISNVESYGLACNFSGPALYSSREIAFHYYANSSLSDTELDNMNTAVQAFQTALSRNV
jgi:hypothetical protein